MDRTAQLEVWLRALGRLHVMTVHFPIALLIAAVLIEFLRRRGSAWPDRAVLWCLGLGALSAAAVAGLGWIHAEAEPLGRTLALTLERHRWAGIATSAVALAAFAFALAAKGRASEGRAQTLRVLLVFAAAGVAVSGHLGAELVWGPGYVLEPFEDEDASVAGSQAAELGAPAASPAEFFPDTEGFFADGAAAPGAASEAPRAPETAEGDPAAPGGLSFVRDVWPILSARCIECHGPRKQKADLRVDRAAVALAPIVVPGDPDASELVRRIELPHDDADVMPARGARLEPGQIAVLRAWIASGAPFEAPPAVDEETLGGPGEGTGESAPPGSEPAGG